MRSSSLMTRISLIGAAALAVAVGCKTSSSSSNMSGGESADGGMGMSMADGGMGMGGMSDGGMMGSMQSGMNAMSDAGSSAMGSMQSGMDSGMSSAQSAMDAGATTAADAARNAQSSAGSMADRAGSMASNAADAGMAEASSAASSATNLSDGQIAGITAAAHKGEIDAAKLARKQSKNSKVKAFAAMMQKQHTSALKTETALAKKAGITPADSDLSQKMTDENKELADKLKDLKGKDFDKAYAQAMADGHQKVLDTIDNVLIPAAQNADLKSQLQKERGVVETHLEHAKKLNDSLGGM